MVEPVGVSDEQLDNWAEVLGDALASMKDVKEARDGLIAEVRASRAREAALTKDLDRWQGIAAAAIARKVIAETERDVLQQRIDKAHQRVLGEVRAAITGTGDTE